MTRDNWNPWHGCVKRSEGCLNCYMFHLDRVRDLNGADIYRTKGKFNYPVQRDRKGNYKIQSGELIRVCMTSDFFLEEADSWRDEAWRFMRKRSDVKFFLLTKRPERVQACLPHNWGDGWENIILNVSCENQRRADERIPYLIQLPFKHKGIFCAPLIGEIHIAEYLKTGKIENVGCGGENYRGARPCNFEWVKILHKECVETNVTFCFVETGTNFIKDGKQYHIPNKKVQKLMTYKSNMNFIGKPSVFKLFDEYGEIPEERLYKPYYGENCEKCGGRLMCNGCSNCGRC